jgi:hypothetical protein
VGWHYFSALLCLHKHQGIDSSTATKKNNGLARNGGREISAAIGRFILKKEDDAIQHDIS